MTTQRPSAALSDIDRALLLVLPDLAIYSGAAYLAICANRVGRLTMTVREATKALRSLEKRGLAYCERHRRRIHWARTATGRAALAAAEEAGV